MKKKNGNFISLILTLIVNAVSLMLTTLVFKGIYVESFWYAILTSLVIVLLNYTVKPVLKVLTIPITIVTLGIFYPFINVIILKLAHLVMGSHFVIEGWFVPFFIAIFLSITTLILDKIVRKIVGE